MRSQLRKTLIASIVAGTAVAAVGEIAGKNRAGHSNSCAGPETGRAAGLEGLPCHWS